MISKIILKILELKDKEGLKGLVYFLSKQKLKNYKNRQKLMNNQGFPIKSC